MSNFYSGSNILSPLVPLLGLSVDKLNFIICQIFVAAIGRSFQKYFPANPGTPNYHRYVATTLIGISICLFCFGHQIFHLLFQATVCLLLMRYANQRHARYLVCAFSIIYLSVCHLLRQYYDYGGYTLDITGPLMISTQRLSSLAFNVHDGTVVAGNNERRKAALTERQKLHYVKDSPTLLQFYTYILHYQGILVGPFIFYSDFQHYMEGTGPQIEGVSPRAHQHYQLCRERIPVVIKWTFFFGLVSLLLPGLFSMEFLTADDFQAYSLLGKWLYLTVACFVLRQKYYFAWSLGELGYLYSGCGFTGIDKKTRQPEHKMVQNFDFTNIERTTSLKVALDHWNISTVNWLRECIYERVPGRHATLAVFLTSAFWHGFYPGYYLMFISLSGFTQVARLARRKLRHRFQATETSRLAYDILTGVCAMATLNYGVGAFTLLEMSRSLHFWWSMYFMVHLIAAAMYIGMVYFLPSAPSAAPAGQPPRGGGGGGRASSAATPEAGGPR